MRMRNDVERDEHWHLIGIEASVQQRRSRCLHRHSYEARLLIIQLGIEEFIGIRNFDADLAGQCLENLWVDVGEALPERASIEEGPEELVDGASKGGYDAQAGDDNLAPDPHLSNEEQRVLTAVVAGGAGRSADGPRRSVFTVGT